MLYESIRVERIFVDTPPPRIGWFYCGYGAGADDVHTMWKGAVCPIVGWMIIIGVLFFVFSFATTTYMRACRSDQTVLHTRGSIEYRSNHQDGRMSYGEANDGNNATSSRYDNYHRKSNESDHAFIFVHPHTIQPPPGTYTPVTTTTTTTMTRRYTPHHTTPKQHTTIFYGKVRCNHRSTVS
jgi:hypothetical protein